MDRCSWTASKDSERPYQSCYTIVHLAGQTDHIAWTRRAEDELPHKKDREILVAAIERADDAFKKIHPPPSLLSSTPKGILDDLALAIERCGVYKTLSG